MLYVAYAYDETPPIIAEFFFLNYTTTGAGSIFNRKLTTESATETLHFIMSTLFFIHEVLLTQSHRDGMPGWQTRNIHVADETH